MGICKNQVIISVTIGFSFGILIGLGFWDYMWKDEFLGKWASMITILSLVGVPITYFSNQNKKENEKTRKETDERNRASRNLYGELHDALEAIEGKKYPEDLLDITIDNKVMTYTNRFLNHDMYDSLVFSGKISFLRYELQQKIQDIFKRIKHHNYYLRLIMKIQDNDESDNTTLKTYKYYELLDKDERYMIEEIPYMMKKLKEEFKFDFPN